MADLMGEFAICEHPLTMSGLRSPIEILALSKDGVTDRHVRTQVLQIDAPGPCSVADDTPSCPSQSQ